MENVLVMMVIIQSLETKFVNHVITPVILVMDLLILIARFAKSLELRLQLNVSVQLVNLIFQEILYAHLAHISNKIDQ